VSQDVHQIGKRLASTWQLERADSNGCRQIGIDTLPYGFELSHRDKQAVEGELARARAPRSGLRFFTQ
jgi:predicted nuclease with TOPRIM domain